MTHVLSNGPIGVVPRPVSIAPPRRKTNRRGPFQFQPGEGANTPHQIGAIYGKHPFQPLHPRTTQDTFLSAEEAIAQGFADKVAGLPTANRTAA